MQLTFISKLFTGVHNTKVC